MNWKSTAIVSGAGLLATWLGWNSQPASQLAGVPAPEPARAVAAPAADIQQQAEKLQSRVHSVSEYHEPSRNPFRFTASVSRPVSSAPRVAIDLPPLAPAVPPAPALSLSGIASDVENGTTIRTAIFSTPSGVVLAKEGESVGGGIRVGKIDEDAADIIDAGGAVRRLTLRP